MKRLYYVFNLLLVIMIITLVFVGNTKVYGISIKTKSLKTSDFNSVQFRIDSPINDIANIISVDNGLNNTNLYKFTKEFSNNLVSGSIITDVLESFIGKMSAYGPDCNGCSGKVGGGQVVTNGNIYYNDSNYGTVRIIAADKKYPYGSIIRIKSNRGEFLAIVMDRGGDIGFGRRFDVDLLCDSEASASSYGTTYNVTFEVLRYGY